MTGSSLLSGAGFIIALGVFILILSFLGEKIKNHFKFSLIEFYLGFFGTYKNRTSLLKLFIASLIVIVLLQFIAAIVAFSLHNKAEDQLRTRLLKSMPNYGKTKVTGQWDRLQNIWQCCGVENATDWLKFGQLETPPKSCCVKNDCSAPTVDGSLYYERGCYQAALNLIFRYSKALGGVAIFFFLIELGGVVLGVFILRDVTNNYGTV